MKNTNAAVLVARIIVAKIIVPVLGLALTSPPLGLAEPQTDEFYPAEESAEQRTIVWPRLVDLNKGDAVLEWPMEAQHTLAVGDHYREWELLAVIPQATPLAVLQRIFPRWGILAYIGQNGSVTILRKSIGSLESLRQGKDFPAQYFNRILSAREDLLGRQALAKRQDPSYEALVDLLPPLRTYTFLGTPASRVKIIVWPDGRFGVGVHDQSLEDVLFDPASTLHIASRPSAAIKQGLVGRYLPVIDYGFFDPKTKSGWEEIAFATGEQALEAYISLRSKGGKPTYWRLPGPQPLENGTAFYRELLGVHQKWEKLFTEGLELQVPEDRVADASKAAIVRALISEVGFHPKYGVGEYGEDEHDTFPPTTIQLNLCLLDWGFVGEVKARLGHYLSTFVKKDGTFDYYGPALSEYGQVLTLAARYVRVTGDTDWMAAHLLELQLIADYLIAKIDASRKKYPADSPYYGLLWGSAEADTFADKRFYFAGNAWCWRGLKDLGQLLNDEGAQKKDVALEQLGEKWLGEASAFREYVLSALRLNFRNDTVPPFLSPVAGMGKPFERMTESEFASYTNYRYWLEMLSPGMLTPAMRDAIITYRTSHGGEVAGTTRFEDHLDDWTYPNYAWGLLEAGQTAHYLLGFYGHLAYHQTPGTFTAYEQVAIKGDSTRTYTADYCVPSEVVIPQMLRWMTVWEPWDKPELWLARAVPIKWFEKGFSARRVPTRWGAVSLDEHQAGKVLTMHVQFLSPHPELTVYFRVRSVPTGAAPKLTVEGTSSWEWDASHQAVKLGGAWNRVTITLENVL